MAAAALPVFATAAEVWRFVLHAQGPLVRLAGPWLLLGFVLAALPPRLGWGAEEDWALAAQVVDLLGYAVVGSRFVRRLVRGEPWPQGPAGPDAAMWRYLFGSLLLASVGFVAGFAAGLVVAVPLALAVGDPRIAVIGVPVTVAVMLWMTARLAPAPVFATTGRGFDLRGAFRLTRGQAVRIVLVHVATLVPLVVLVAAGVGLFVGLLGDPEGELPPFLDAVLELLLRSVGYAEAALIGTALAAITVRLELRAAGEEAA